MKKKKGPLILTGVLVILLILYFGLSSWNKKQDKKEEKEKYQILYLKKCSVNDHCDQVSGGSRRDVF